METYQIRLTIIAVYVIAGIISALVFRADKLAAINSQWRVANIVLILLIWIFGVFGATFAMFFYHHKTSKLLFIVNLVLALAFHSLVIWQLFKLVGLMDKK